MKNLTQHEGELKILTRLDSSTNGNPRFLISIDGFVCKTGVDCMHGYTIQNLDGARVKASIGTHYGSATLNQVNKA